MGVYIKSWSLADWKELLKWAKIGANNAMIGEFTEVEELPPHGRLIDADCDVNNYVTVLPQTNADRIRAMTDEELMSVFQNVCCPYSLDIGEWKGSCEIETKGCGKCWLDWLRQEINNEN